MSSEVRVTPLFGADPEAPVASIMEMSGLRILLDCGWTEEFDASMWDPFKEVLETVNILLLSHGDLEHAGALPLLKGRWGLKMRVLATLPVQRMIQMVLYDTYYNVVERQEFDTFDMEDVDEAVDKVETLRYTEERRITTEEGEGLSLYPFPAGRTLGGCGWKIVQESQEIAYVVDYYHRNERLLGGLMFQALQRPSLLVTDGMVGLPSLQREQKEKLMLGRIISTLRQGGNVLLPVDTATRCFETLLLLNKFWDTNKFGQYPIVFLHHTAHSTINMIQSHVEWMRVSLQKEFENTQINPMRLEHIRCCHSVEQLRDIPPPMVVLSTSPSLMNGAGLALFMDWASDDRNSVVFTHMPRRGTTGRKLVDDIGQRTIHIKTSIRVPIDGEELESWKSDQLRQLREEREANRLKKEREELLKEMRRKTVHDEDVEEDEAQDEKGVEMRMDDGEAEQNMDVMEPNAKLFLPSSILFFSKHPLFPCIDPPKGESSAYGTAADHESLFTIDGRTPKIAGQNADIVDDDMEIEISDEERVNQIAVPERVVKIEDDVSVRCSIFFFDFSERPDIASIHRILKEISPKKMVLLRGMMKSREEIRSRAVANPETQDVFLGEKGAETCIPMDRMIHLVRLNEASVDEHVSLRQIHGVGVAYVEGDVVGDVVADREFVARDPIGEGAMGHSTLFLGDVKMSDLHSALTEKGLRVEFLGGGGGIVCNDRVVIHKVNASAIRVESSLCREYFLVRQVLYNSVTRF